MRVLVTGAGGFIGQAAVAALQGAGHDVHPARSQDLDDVTDLRFQVGRIAPEAALLLGWCGGPGLLANQSGNALALERTLRLLQALAETDCKRIVVAGSGIESQQSGPTAAAPYTRAKQVVHTAVLEMTGPGRTTACAHIFGVTGPGEPVTRVTPQVIRALLAGRPINVSTGTQRRDLLHIRDVASALLTVVAADMTGTIDISSGASPTLRAWFELLESHTGRTGLVHFGAASLDPRELYDNVGDPARLRSLGWRPDHDLPAIAADTVQWWRTHRLNLG